MALAGQAVFFSVAPRSREKELAQIVRSLGGAVASRLEDAAVAVFLGGPLPFLQKARTLGVSVVTPAWIERCAAARTSLPLDGFLASSVKPQAPGTRARPYLDSESEGEVPQPAPAPAPPPAAAEAQVPRPVSGEEASSAVKRHRPGALQPVEAIPTPLTPKLPMAPPAFLDADSTPKLPSVEPLNTPVSQAPEEPESDARVAAAEGGRGGKTPVGEILAAGRLSADSPSKCVDPFDDSAEDVTLVVGKDEEQPLVLPQTDVTLASSSRDGKGASNRSRRKGRRETAEGPAVQPAAAQVEVVDVDGGGTRKTNRRKRPRGDVEVLSEAVQVAGARSSVAPCAAAAAAPPALPAPPLPPPEKPRPDTNGQHQVGQVGATSLVAPTPERPLLIALSGGHDTRECVTTILEHLKVPYTDRVFGRCPKPSHLVVEGDELTPKVLYALAAGIPVLNTSWVYESLDSGASDKRNGRKRRRSVPPGSKGSLSAMTPIQPHHYHRFYDVPRPFVSVSSVLPSAVAVDAARDSVHHAAEQKERQKGAKKFVEGIKGEAVARGPRQILAGWRIVLLGVSEVPDNSVFAELLTLLGADVSASLATGLGAARGGRTAVVVAMEELGTVGAPTAKHTRETKRLEGLRASCRAAVRSGHPVVTKQWIVDTVHALEPQPLGRYAAQTVQDPEQLLHTVEVTVVEGGGGSDDSQSGAFLKKEPGPVACAKSAGNQWNTQQVCCSSDDGGEDAAAELDTPL